MKKDKGLSIGNKIKRAVLLASIITSVVTGLVGITCITIINSTTQLEYKQNLVPLTHLYKVETDLLSIRVLLRNMALTKDSDTSTLTKYANDYFMYMNDLNDNEDAYGKALTSKEQLNNYKDMQSQISKCNVIANNLQNEVLGGDIDDALNIMNGDETKAFTALDNDVTKAFNINSAQAQQHNQNGFIIFFVAVGSIILIIAVSILITRKQSSRIAKRISGPINDMVKVANSIADGNLEISTDVNSDDETGVLAEAFKKIITSLQQLRSDIELLIGDALVGNLDTRADLGKHNGDYRSIVQGANEMLDAIKEPLDVAYDFVGKLAKGEHQEKIKNTYSGYYGKLIDNLNDVRDSIAILEEEANKLAVAGQNGNLEVRGDDSRLNGTYAEIISGVNKTFDSIKQPLDISSVFIDKLANGIKTDALDNTYKGYYAKLIDNLNEVNASLNALQSESEKMNIACENGSLEVRGNTGALKGSYAEIINGFNKTLDSVVAPLKESEKILAKYAVNDYTAQMSDGYKGILNDFAQSINNVREHFVEIEKIVSQVGVGRIDALDTLKEIGKRSENDKMTPSLILMMTAIKNLVDDVNRQASAAIEGNLGSRGDEEKFSGGYREIIEGMNRTLEAISAPIEESSAVLKELAQGNLGVKMTGEYKGGYNSIKTDLNAAIESFNELISEISISADQVATGSKQISDASQSLSQGTTEQASSIEELTSAITEIGKKARENFKNISQSGKITKDSQAEAKLGNEKMKEMLESMKVINESSTSISKIIKVIDDIAFQTNILALNAAVEAARAGQYGKGFAVVAEEVRNLASKSADAAKETSSLIESSISKVEAGAKTADETADILLKINKSIGKASEFANNIVSASNEQATAIAQINQGLSLVSNVVQTNSATAEESAASSEELSSQAENLKQLIGNFKLKDSNSESETEYF